MYSTTCTSRVIGRLVYLLLDRICRRSSIYSQTRDSPLSMSTLAFHYHQEQHHHHPRKKITAAGSDGSNDGDAPSDAGSWGGIDDPPLELDETTGAEPAREGSASPALDENAIMAQKILLLRQICMTCLRREVKEYMDNPPAEIVLPTFHCEFAESSIGADNAPRTTRKKKSDIKSITARCAHCNANNRTCAPISQYDPFSHRFR